MKMLIADKPEDIDKWDCPNYVFTGKCNCKKDCGVSKLINVKAVKE